LPQKFADVLLDLVRNRGITHLKWVTIQNEPNRTRITMETYEKQYRDLDPLIQSIRGQVRYMGGDLVRGPDTGAPNQEAWFQDLAADLGYIGTSKWDSYFGKYDNATQAYYAIGDPQSGWPLYPMYNLLQLFTTTVKRGWQVVAVDAVPGTSRLLAAYQGKSKQL